MEMNLKQNLLLGAILMVCFAIPRFLDTFAWAELFLGAALFLGANAINNKMTELDRNDA